jgi:phosphatidylserine/phosphatidylglycerophosphate/cardiolipin synthase-like enzyme
MTPQDVEKMLAATLQDFRLTDGERRAMAEALTEAGLDEHKRALYRSMAFDLAGKAISDPEARRVLGWLESVLKVLVPRGGDALPTVEAVFSPEQDGAVRIATLFGKVRQSADVCVFTVTDDRIAEAITAAARRGVAVRIISDDDKSLDVGSDVQRFRDAGIPVRLDRTKFHMHHKYAVFDGGTVITGSYNWTRSAARDNLENFIVTDDRRLTAAFARNFERLWAELGK